MVTSLTKNFDKNFLRIYLSGCQFIAYPCQGGSESFAQGRCFIQPKKKCLPGDPECNIMGMGAYPNGARGVLYLATRDSDPFCGKPNKFQIINSTKWNANDLRNV